MSEAKVGKTTDMGDYIEEKVIVDSTPNTGDKTGEIFLNEMEKAIGKCKEFISEGYRLVDFWGDPYEGIEFIMKKKKK